MIDVLRSALLVLTACNLVWTLPLAFQAARNGVVEHYPNAGFTIPLAGLLLGIGAFQIGYLFEGVPEIPHWRISINLLLVIVSEALLLGMWAAIHGPRVLERIKCWRR